MTLIQSFILGIFSGGLLWFWLFALAFTRSYSEFYIDAIMPLILAAFVSAIVASRYPQSWLIFALTMNAPILFMGLQAFLLVFSEGRGVELTHSYTPCLVLFSTTAGGTLANVIARYRTNKDKQRGQAKESGCVDEAGKRTEPSLTV